MAHSVEDEHRGEVCSVCDGLWDDMHRKYGCPYEDVIISEDE